MEQSLPPEAIAIIKQAQEQSNKLQSAGAGENIVESEEHKTYDNFIEVKGMPSNNYFYPNPISGQAVKVEDLLLIQSIDDDNLYTRFNEIFARRLRGINAGDILFADQSYLAFWLRESSYPGYKFPLGAYKCEKCGLEVPDDVSEFGFEAISFDNNIAEMKELYGDKEFAEFDLPNGTKCKIYIKRRKHVLRAQAILNEDYHQKEKVPPEGIEELLELMSVVDIGLPELRDTVSTIMGFSAIDFNTLITNVKKYSFTSEMVVNSECPNPDCKEVTPIMGYPFRPEIYFPGNT